MSDIHPIYHHMITRDEREAKLRQRARVDLALRPVRVRQKHARHGAGGAAVRGRLRHHAPRRRQPARRAQPRPRLHRCGPRGKHPARGRGVEALRAIGHHLPQLVHHAEGVAAATRAGHPRRGKSARNLRRVLVRNLPPTRREGALQKGRGWARPQLHREGIGLRAARPGRTWF